MPFDRTKLSRPSRSMGLLPLLRLTILLTNTVAIALFIIILILFNSWASSYNLFDWNDALMTGVLLFSLIWTLVIYIRPAWTSAPLHPGHLVAWELICWLFILGCGMPSLLISNILDILDIDEWDGDCGEKYASWRCRPRIRALKGLAIVATTFAFVIATLHFILFVFACRHCDRYNKAKKNKMVRIESDVELVSPIKA